MPISRHSSPTTAVALAVADGSTTVVIARPTAHRRSRRAPAVLLAAVACVLSLGA